MLKRFLKKESEKIEKNLEEIERKEKENESKLVEHHQIAKDWARTMVSFFYDETITINHNGKFYDGCYEGAERVLVGEKYQREYERTLRGLIENKHFKSTSLASIAQGKLQTQKKEEKALEEIKEGKMSVNKLML